MSKFLRYAAVGAAVASFGIASGAQAATTAEANATATILTNLSVDIVPGYNTLDFGSISDNGITATQTLDVAADGTAGTCPTGLTCSGLTRAAKFLVKGTVTKVVNITLPAASSTLGYVGTAPSGFASTSLSVGNFVTDKAGNQLTIVAGGTNFSVGGTLSVPADTAPGLYSGTLTVSVAYN